MQVLASSSTAMKVVQKVTGEEGGEIEARGVAFLPRNAQQASNIRRSIHGKLKESDVLYSLMLECKLAQGYLCKMSKQHQNLSQSYSLTGKPTTLYGFAQIGSLSFTYGER